MTENNVMEQGWLWEVYHVFILLVFLWHHTHTSTNVINIKCSPWHNFQFTFQDLLSYRFLLIFSGYSRKSQMANYFIFCCSSGAQVGNNERKCPGWNSVFFFYTVYTGFIQISKCVIKEFLV